MHVTPQFFMWIWRRSAARALTKPLHAKIARLDRSDPFAEHHTASCPSLASRLGKQLQQHCAVASCVCRGSASRRTAGSRSIPGRKTSISCPRSRRGRRRCAPTPGLRRTRASSRRGREPCPRQLRLAACSSPKKWPDREWGALKLICRYSQAGFAGSAGGGAGSARALLACESVSYLLRPLLSPLARCVLARLQMLGGTLSTFSVSDPAET